MPAPTDAAHAVPLPADDPALADADFEELDRRWADAAGRTPISAETMTGTDRRAQALGVAGDQLMEHAGTATAAVARALAVRTGRLDRGPVLILCGPGNNGGDGLVAARRLAHWGVPVVVALVSTEARPSTRDGAANWRRLEGLDLVTRVHVPVARDVQILSQGVERASVIVDALLGTGVRGVLREPIRSAVELIRRAHDHGVPVLAVDTPTALDLTSGDPSDPVVRADVTVTFHRPKTGLRTKVGHALAGKVLVAPIGIPSDADRA